MKGSAIAAGFAAVVAGIIIADVLIHPQGTYAAGQAAQAVLVPSYNALLGGTSPTSTQAPTGY